MVHVGLKTTVLKFMVMKQHVSASNRVAYCVFNSFWTTLVVYGARISYRLQNLSIWKIEFNIRPHWAMYRYKMWRLKIFVDVQPCVSDLACCFVQPCIISLQYSYLPSLSHPLTATSLMSARSPESLYVSSCCHRPLCRTQRGWVHSSFGSIHKKQWCI